MYFFSILINFASSMIISYNWLKRLINIQLDTNNIAEILTQTGLEIEKISSYCNIKGGLNGLVVGEVIEVNQHPNADKLKLTKVNIGKDTLLNIVCGAPNVAISQKVIVAAVGTTIYPLKSDPITMKLAKIRGEASEGMICAEDEIGIGNSHDGIYILADDAIVGSPLSNYIPVIEDTLFEIGLTPNRGDAASHLGVARDLKAVLKQHITFPDITKCSLNSDTNAAIKINIENHELCSVYSYAIFKNIEIQNKTTDIQHQIAKLGINPKNNIVDITNFIMFELGQPMHAFDLDKIDGNISVRLAKPNETLTTLDQIERTMKGGELVIADDHKILALAGVIGGLNSCIDENTKNILVESATFSPSMVRKTAKLHGINTDSSFRFERGTDYNLCSKALERFCYLIQKPESKIIQKSNFPEHLKISFEPSHFNQFCGTSLTDESIKTILEYLDFKIEVNQNNWNIEIPSYRTEVTRNVDVYEEILRIHGFDNVELPKKMGISTQAKNRSSINHDIKTQVSEYLSSNGFSELLNNSLSHQKYYPQYQKEELVSMLNPLSNELEILRPDLLPHVLLNIAYNKNRKSHNLMFFEFGRTYLKSGSEYKESEQLIIAYTGLSKQKNWKSAAESADYFFLKGIVNNLISRFSSSAKAILQLAQVPSDILELTDIKSDVYYAVIDWNLFTKHAIKSNFKFQEIPIFPEVERDLSIVVDKNLAYESIETIVHNVSSKYLSDASLTDIYMGKPLEEHQKSVTLKIKLIDKEKTMSDKQIDSIMNKMITNFEQELNAIIRK